MIALIYAGYDYAGDLVAHRRAFERHLRRARRSITFKTVIPIAGALVLLQGLAEIVRCVVCLKTGEWPERLKDAEEIDVVEQQLAGSTLVDEESRKRAIESAHDIDEAAHQRGIGAATRRTPSRRNERSRTRAADAHADRGRDHAGLSRRRSR